MKKIIYGIILLFALSGCTTQWVKNRAGAEDFTHAKISCEDLAENKFPVKNEVAQETKYHQYQVKCKKKEDCDGDEYKSVYKPAIQSYVMDVNNDSRKSYFYQCMSNNGWESETKWMI